MELHFFVVFVDAVRLVDDVSLCDESDESFLIDYW